MLEEEEQHAEKECETIKIDVPVLKKPKIVGVIDLSTINAQVRPKKKTKETLRKEKEEWLSAQKASREKLRKKRKRTVKKEKEISVEEQPIEIEDNVLEQNSKKTGLKGFFTRLFKLQVSE